MLPTGGYVDSLEAVAHTSRTVLRYLCIRNPFELPDVWISVIQIAHERSSASFDGQVVRGIAWFLTGSSNDDSKRCRNERAEEHVVACDSMEASANLPFLRDTDRFIVRERTNSHHDCCTSLPFL